MLFHNGDFSYGGSADPLLYGDMFTRAHPDIVFVSFNYRLGILGFIDFSRVPGGDAYPDAPNLGLLGNSEALQMYGNVMDEDSSEILHSFLHKFVNGEELQLYPNEIRKVDAIDWKPFPAALVVADTIELHDMLEEQLPSLSLTFSNKKALR